MSQSTTVSAIPKLVQLIEEAVSQEMPDRSQMMAHLRECRQLGVEVLPVDLNASEAACAIEDGKNIRLGFSLLIPKEARLIEDILTERQQQGRFRSFQDFCERIELELFPEEVITRCIQAGAFDSIEISRARLFLGWKKIMQAARKARTEKATGQISLFAMLPPSPKTAIELPDAEEWTAAEKIAHEKEAVGFSFTEDLFQRELEDTPEAEAAEPAELDAIPSSAPAIELPMTPVVTPLRFPPQAEETVTPLSPPQAEETVTPLRFPPQAGETATPLRFPPQAGETATPLRFPPQAGEKHLASPACGGLRGENVTDLPVTPEVAQHSVVLDSTAPAAVAGSPVLVAEPAASESEPSLPQADNPAELQPAPSVENAAVAPATPVAAAATPPSKFYIQLSIPQTTEQTLLRLRTIMQNHPGNARVILEFHDVHDNKTRVCAHAEYSVAISTALVQAVETVTGEKTVVGQS